MDRVQLVEQVPGKTILQFLSDSPVFPIIQAYDSSGRIDLHAYQTQISSGGTRSSKDALLNLFRSSSSSSSSRSGSNST